MKNFLAITVSIILLFSVILTIGCGSVAEHEHEYGGWTIVKETNSCQVEGLREHKCSICGKTEQESFYGEHNARSAWTIEDDLHYRICRTCGQRFSEGAHFYSDGKCVCGKEEVITTFWDVPDFIVEVPTGRDAVVLFLADTQMIDSTQQRAPDRLWPSEITLYQPENMDALCFDYVRAVVSEVNPDLIILVGDNVYGEFDDLGTSLRRLINVMESFEIPWAPINGNHDNESAKGAKWQNAQFEAAEHCLFKKGDTDGNGNYTIAIKQGNEITRMFYLMDSNWCRNASNPDLNKVLYQQHGFTKSQVKWMYDRMEALEMQYGKSVNSSLCFHIATSEYSAAAKQYNPTGGSFSLGKMETPVWNMGDYGTRTCPNDDYVGEMEEYAVPGVYNKTFLEILKQFSVDTTFAGHCHMSNTSIMYEGIRWTYCLKTGKMCSYNEGELGGTKFSFNATRYLMNNVYSDL